MTIGSNWSEQGSPFFKTGSGPSRRQLIHLAGGLATLTIVLPVTARNAWSQVPKTIRFIVPFPAGGGADLLVRVLSEQIGRSAGATTVVENRPGAASIVGTEFVSRATPDGGTVLIEATPGRISTTVDPPARPPRPMNCRAPPR